MFPSNPIGINIEAAIGASNATSSRSSRVCGNCSDKIFDCLVYFTRFWGVLTAIVLAGVGIDFIFHDRYPGYWLIAFAVVIFVAEVLWVVTLFLKLSVRADHKVWRIWQYVTMLEGWWKSPIYLVLGVVSMYEPYKLWLVYLAGGFTIFLGALHLSVSIFQRILKRRRKRKEHRYGHGDLDSLESSKFEEVTEVLDDCLPEPIPGSSVSLSDSLHTEQDILEI